MIVKESCYGCIPNKNCPQAVAGILNSAVPWDGSDIPPNVSWDSFEAYLDTLPDIEVNWWTGIDIDKHFTASQEYRPNCAGFAKANASECALILQNKLRFSEQRIDKFNPMVCWQLSKGGSVSGGQSIAEMASAGNTYGNFLASDCGDYDPSVVFRNTTNKQEENAKLHQDSISLYDGKYPASAVMKICRKGYSCFVGNSIAVSGAKIDKNGVRVAVLGGYWSHATAFCGFKTVNDTNYVFWINSHGNIYKVDGAGEENESPLFGCWMSEETLNRFMSSSFNDLCAIPYVESPYDETIKPTLNPEA